MSAASDSALTPEQPLTEMERVIDTFVAPSKTFTDIRRNASWWVPWLLMAIFGLGMVFVVDKKLGMDTAYENQLRLSPKQMDKIDQMPADQKAQTIRIGTNVTRYVSYGWPIMTIIFLAIIAAVLMATFNFGFGAAVKFKQALAVSMYASLPSIIKVLIAIAVVASGAAEGFTFQNPVASNLSGLVDPTSSHFLYSILASIDIFTIWTLILTGIGYSCITRVKRGTCLGVVFGWWALTALIGAGVGALFA
ncbi:MAG TPA: YIP1 family protein [Candidatus Angelobacter sp.]|nr:YIP1 family protein [Candidatus Angelobacter sp.]